LNGIDVKPPEIPVISNVTGELFPKDPNAIRELLIEQAYSPVKWEQSIRKMIELGADRFVEVGPGKVLSGFMKKIDRSVSVESTENEGLGILKELQEIKN